MNMEIARVAFWVACNVLYYVGAILLLRKNPPRSDVRAAGIGAILFGPFLIMFPSMQLVFVILLCTVFAIHGFTVPSRLPLKTIGLAIGLTIAAFVLLIAVLIWTEPES